MLLQITSTQFIAGFSFGIMAAVLFVFFRYTQLLKGREHLNRILAEQREEVEQERRNLLAKTKDEIHRKKTDLELEIKKRKIEMQGIEMRLQSKTEVVLQQEKDLAELKLNTDKLQRDLSHRTDRLMADESRVKKIQHDIETQYSWKRAAEILLEKVKEIGRSKN